MNEAIAIGVLLSLIGIGEGNAQIWRLATHWRLPAAQHPTSQVTNSQLPIIKPDLNTDYKMIVIKPDTSVDYSGLSIPYYPASLTNKEQVLRRWLGTIDKTR